MTAVVHSEKLITLGDATLGGRLNETFNNRLAIERSERTAQLMEARRERQQERRQIRSESAGIFNQIPSALEVAAENPQARGRELAITARIPVVTECFSSIMQAAGALSSHDERLLAQVRKDLANKKFKGGVVTLKSERFEGGYRSADGEDEVHGPCRRFFLEATVRVPRR